MMFWIPTAVICKLWLCHLRRQAGEKTFALLRRRR